MGITKIIKAHLLVCVLVLLTSSLRGQGPSLIFDVGELNGCYLDTVMVPVTVSNYQDIMAFSFYVEWDYDSLRYIGIVNNQSEDLVLVADTTRSPLDGLKLIIGTGDLLSPDVALARSFADGDTLAFIKLVVLARESSWPITSQPAVLISNAFFYNNNGARAFSEDLTIVPGEVRLTNNVEGLGIVGDSIFCGHPVAVLGAFADNPNTDFTWSLSGTEVSEADTLATTVPGIYDLMASRGAFCTSAVNYEVLRDTASANPVLATEDLACDPMEATQRIVSPNPQHTYEWQRNGVALSQGSELTVSTAGTYLLISTNPASSCVDTQTVVVSSPVLSMALEETELLGAALLTCSNVAANLYVPLPGSGYTFAWARGAAPLGVADSVITVSTGGRYSLTITDENDGCVRVLDTLIQQSATDPEVRLEGRSVIDCRAEVADLMAVTDVVGANYSYVWEDALGNEAANGANFAVSEAGDYVLVAADADNDCITRITTTIRQDTLAPAVRVLGSIDPVTCGRSQSMVVVLEEPETVYRWLDGTDTIRRGAGASLGAGEFGLVALNTRNGCRNDTLITVAADTLRPVFTIDSSGALNCGASEVILTINSPDSAYECFWNTVQASDCSIQVSAPGTYTGRLFNPGNECFAVREIEVVASLAPNPIIPLSVGEISCFRDSVELAVGTPENGVSYEWRDESGNVIGRQPSLFVYDEGTYRVAVANQAGVCARAAEIAVTADTVAPTVSLPDLELNCDVTSVPLAFTSATENVIPVWTNESQDTLSDLQITRGGTYTLQLTDPDNGCAISRILEVPENRVPPDYQINQPIELDLTCNQPTVNARVTYTGDYEVNWSQSPGTIITGADSTRIFASGEVLLTVRDRENGCADSTLLTVTDLRVPPRLNYNAPSFLNCGESAGDISVVPEPDVVFSLVLPDGTGTSPMADGTFGVGQTGQYTILAENTTTGCTASEVFSIDQPVTDLSFSGLAVSQQTCSPGSNSEVFLGDGAGGTPAYTFSVAGQSYPPFDIVTGLPDGTYDLRLTDGRQCFVDTVINIRGYEPFEPQIEGLEQTYRIGEEVVLSVQNSLSPNSTYVYTWRLGDSLCEACPVYEFVALESSDVLLVVERSDGCLEEVRANLRVDERAQLYLPTAFSPNNDGINDRYLPQSNPAMAEVTEFVVYNRWGQECYREKTNQGQPLSGWDGRIRGGMAAGGTYVTLAFYELPDGRQGHLEATFDLLR